MTKLVNLDELSAPRRILTYKGVEHEVLDLEVEQFLKFQTLFDQLVDAQNDRRLAEMVAIGSEMIKMAVPSLENPERMNMRQMLASIQLISDFFPAAEDQPTAGNA